MEKVTSHPYKLKTYSKRRRMYKENFSGDDTSNAALYLIRQKRGNNWNERLQLQTKTSRKKTRFGNGIVKESMQLCGYLIDVN